MVKSTNILSGTVFGRWTVLETKSPIRKNSRVYYLCKCECGLEKEILGKNLVQGSSRGCKECAIEDRRSHKSTENIPGTAYSRVLQSASNGRRDIPVEVTIKDLDNLWTQQQGLCAYTKLPLSLKSHSPNMASLDRIDSNKGYTVDNIQFLHKDINRFKNNYTEDKFFEMCRLVSFHKDHTKNLREGRRPWLQGS